MVNKTVNLSSGVDEIAEGSPDSYEVTEPASPLKTATIPVFSKAKSETSPASENGLSSTVKLKAEGEDDGEAQDAALTTDEAKKVPETEAEQETKASPTILIVEDTTELAEVIQATLERMNMVTAHETHGTKAVEKFNEMNPDVLLLDISLPDMTGWKILDVVKEKREKEGVTANMPTIIVITAYGDPANRLVGKLQGVHSYLIKPFTSDEIEKVVTQALADRK